MTTNQTSDDFINILSKYSNAENARNLQRFFKTAPGEYGEGDKFIGLKVPDIRKTCKQFKDLPISEVKKLIYSPIHEYRMGGIIILAMRFNKVSIDEQKTIYEMYIKAVDDNKINNWDLVDVTCGYIVGEYFWDKDRTELIEFANSKNLWKKRVSMISTLAFIVKGDSSTTMTIAKILLNDKHDLIHKAVGWMLREVGKRVDEKILTDFLEQYSKVMPRTMLRYACEKLTRQQKDKYYSR